MSGTDHEEPRAHGRQGAYLAKWGGGVAVVPWGTLTCPAAPVDSAALVLRV